MFSRFIKKIFGHRLSDFKYREYLDVIGKSADLQIKNDELRLTLKDVITERNDLRNKLKSKDFSILVKMGDPSPVDKVQRSLYVAQVAGLHKDILEPKLKHMISNTFQMLKSSTNDRDYDQSLKGAIYFAEELILWGNNMVNEQIAIQTEQNNSSPEDKNIKS